MSPPLQCVVVLGPTAVGKTRLDVSLARHFRGEIVSADSRQVYQGLDIGTGKDLMEYGSGPERIPAHLIDIVAPTEEYHLFRFLADARQAVQDISGRGKLPVIVGGTAMYLNALVSGYEPEGAGPNPELRAQLKALPAARLIEMLRQESPEIYSRTDRTQKRRVIRGLEIARSREQTALPAAPVVALDCLLMGPYYPRPTIHKRIAARLHTRLRGGLIEEVKQLHEGGLSWKRLDDFGLEYRYVARHLHGELTFKEMRDTLLARIRRFCRAQEIWFRKMEREGRQIHWIPGGDVQQARHLVTAFMRGDDLPAPEIRLMDIRYGPDSNR